MRGLLDVERRSGVEVAPECDRRTGRQPGHRAKLQPEDIETSSQRRFTGLHPIDLEELQALGERRRRAALHAIANDAEPATVRREQFADGGQHPLRGEKLTRLRPHVGT